MGEATEMTMSRIRPRRILVVDDEPSVCDSIRLLLTFEGHVVSTARSAAEALQTLSPDDFDLLITDYAMPGMNGAELASEVRVRFPKIPIILVTAYAEMLGMWGADLSGVDSVVSKPFRLGNLRKALAAAVDEVASDH